MGILVAQNNPIVSVGQPSALLDGREVARAWGEPQYLQDLAVAPPPGVLIPLGGRATTHDDEARLWLEAERELTRRCASTSMCVLGICLGAQLITVTFGGRINIADPSSPERGVIPLVRSTNDQAGGGGAVPLHMALASIRTVFIGHGSAIVELPRGTRERAHSDKYTQTFSYGTALGVQFHPEVTREIATAWAANNEDIDTEDIAADYDAHEGDLASTCKALAGWVSGVL